MDFRPRLNSFLSHRHHCLRPPPNILGTWGCLFASLSSGTGKKPGARHTSITLPLCLFQINDCSLGPGRLPLLAASPGDAEGKGEPRITITFVLGGVQAPLHRPRRSMNDFIPEQLLCPQVRKQNRLFGSRRLGAGKRNPPSRVPEQRGGAPAPASPR